jgi:hypothetical protein
LPVFSPGGALGDSFSSIFHGSDGDRDILASDGALAIVAEDIRPLAKRMLGFDHNVDEETISFDSLDKIDELSKAITSKVVAGVITAVSLQDIWKEFSKEPDIVPIKQLGDIEDVLPKDAPRWIDRVTNEDGFVDRETVKEFMDDTTRDLAAFVTGCLDGNEKEEPEEGDIDK